MMLGSKPAPVDPEGVGPAATKCSGPWAFLQHLVLLQPHADAPDENDPWQRGVIPLQYTDPDEQEEPGALLKEKNWRVPGGFLGRARGQGGSARAAWNSSRGAGERSCSQEWLGLGFDVDAGARAWSRMPEPPLPPLAPPNSPPRL